MAQPETDDKGVVIALAGNDSFFRLDSREIIRLACGNGDDVRAWTTEPTMRLSHFWVYRMGRQMSLTGPIKPEGGRSVSLISRFARLLCT